MNTVVKTFVVLASLMVFTYSVDAVPPPSLRLKLIPRVRAIYPTKVLHRQRALVPFKAYRPVAAYHVKSAPFVHHVKALAPVVHHVKAPAFAVAPVKAYSPAIAVAPVVKAVAPAVAYAPVKAVAPAVAVAPVAAPVPVAVSYPRYAYSYAVNDVATRDNKYQYEIRH